MTAAPHARTEASAARSTRDRAAAALADGRRATSAGPREP